MSSKNNRIGNRTILLCAFLCSAMLGVSPLHASESILPPEPIGEHDCRSKTMVVVPDIIIAFIVTAEGQTRDFKVKQSSGLVDIDTAAIQCVSAFKYQPATLNGLAIEYPWATRVQWQTGTKDAPIRFPGLGPAMQQLKGDEPSDPLIIPNEEKK